MTHEEPETEGKLNCIICLSGGDKNTVWVALPGCGHVYHMHCAEHWIGSRAKATCPQCKVAVGRNQQPLRLWNVENIPKCGSDATPLKARGGPNSGQSQPVAEATAQEYQARIDRLTDQMTIKQEMLTSLNERSRALEKEKSDAVEQQQKQTKRIQDLRAEKLRLTLENGTVTQSLRVREEEISRLRQQAVVDKEDADRRVRHLEELNKQAERRLTQQQKELDHAVARLQQQDRMMKSETLVKNRVSEDDVRRCLEVEGVTGKYDMDMVVKVLLARQQSQRETEQALVAERAARQQEAETACQAASTEARRHMVEMDKLKREWHQDRLEVAKLENEIILLKEQLLEAQQAAADARVEGSEASQPWVAPARPAAARPSPMARPQATAGAANSHSIAHQQLPAPSAQLLHPTGSSQLTSQGSKGSAAGVLPPMGPTSQCLEGAGVGSSRGARGGPTVDDAGQTLDTALQTLDQSGQPTVRTLEVAAAAAAGFEATEGWDLIQGDQGPHGGAPDMVGMQGMAHIGSMQQQQEEQGQSVDVDMDMPRLPGSMGLLAGRGGGTSAAAARPMVGQRAWAGGAGAGGGVMQRSAMSAGPSLVRKRDGQERGTDGAADTLAAKRPHMHGSADPSPSSFVGKAVRPSWAGAGEARRETPFSSMSLNTMTPGGACSSKMLGQQAPVRRTGGTGIKDSKRPTGKQASMSMFLAKSSSCT